MSRYYNETLGARDSQVEKVLLGSHWGNMSHNALMAAGRKEEEGRWETMGLPLSLEDHAPNELISLPQRLNSFRVSLSCTLVPEAREGLFNKWAIVSISDPNQSRNHPEDWVRWCAERSAAQDDSTQ